MREITNIAHVRQKNQKYSYEIKVAACADYLIGLSYKEIEHKWNVPITLATRWVKERKCFKIRRSKKC